MRRRLTLTRETLTELTSTDLRDVVAGAVPSGRTCPLKACLNSDYNCLFPTQEGCTPAIPG